MKELIDYWRCGNGTCPLIGSDAKGQRGGVLRRSPRSASPQLLPTRGTLDELVKLAQSGQTDAKVGSSSPRLTSTREALRRLHAAWINILLGQLLGDTYVVSHHRPCWMVIAEVHALKHLPILNQLWLKPASMASRCAGDAEQVAVRRTLRTGCSHDAGFIAHQDSVSLQRNPNPRAGFPK